MSDDLLGCFNRGNALLKEQRYDEALEQYDRALALSPGQPRVLLNRGVALRKLERYEEAAAALEASVRAEPDSLDALRALSHTLFMLRRPEAALPCGEKALALDPNSANLHAQQGVALRMARRPREALAAFRTAQTLDPAGRYESYIGACELMLGDLVQGWRDFEHRGHSREAGDLAARRAPKWVGQDPRGKTVLVHAEQGFGDSIQFSRYLSLIAARGAQVLFAPQPPLKRLFASLTWPSAPARPLQFVNLTDPGLTFDYQVRTMSLPLAFETRLETIPGDTPYLAAEPGLAARWRADIGGQGFKIGVAWKGQATAMNSGRGFDPRLLAPIAGLPGVRLISLQKDDPDHDAASLAALGIETPAGEIDGGGDAFVDTAAIIKSCDLVITLDSAVAHLAGALACPTWIALARHGEWRWLMDRTESPWYPTTRLWRQQTLDDWVPVFGAMAAALNSGRL